jgi:predicted amidohydrolase
LGILKVRKHAYEIVDSYMLTKSFLDMPVEEMEKRAIFQHLLVMQSFSYTNATFSIAAARAGYDDGKYGMIGASCIIHPEGHIIAQSKTMDDELVIADIDLDDTRAGKERVFDFGRHRRTEHYGIITEQTGVVEPAK